MKVKKDRRAHGWIALLLFLALGLVLFYRGFFTRWYAAPLSPQSAVAIPPLPPSFKLTPVETFRFEDEASLARWERKVFKGQTKYEIHRDPAGPYLRALSEDSSCGLFMKTRHEAVPELYLRWKWRVREFPKKKNPTRLSNRAEDDFGARIYVIFEASNLFRSDVIEYVWDESIPAGEVMDSPYSERVKLFVVRSGMPPEDGAWQEETRNLLEDYRRLFGKAPKHPVGIVALMCDSDNTGTRAAADFDGLTFGSSKE